MSNNSWPKMLYRKGANGLENKIFNSAEEVTEGWGSRRAALGLPESEQPVLVNQSEVAALREQVKTLTTENAALKAQLAKADDKKVDPKGAGKVDPKADDKKADAKA